MAACQGGWLVVHFTNRENAPFLFSTRIGTRPRVARLRGEANRAASIGKGHHGVIVRAPVHSNVIVDSLIGALREWEFRGKKRLLDPFVPPRGIRRARVYDGWMDLDLGDHIQRSIFLGCVGPDEVAAVRRTLRPGGVMVDAGANVGYFTLLGAYCVGPLGRVYAVEPSPSVFAKLSTAVASSGLRHVELFPFALGEVAGEAALHIPPDSKGNHSPTMVPTSEWSPITVTTRTLDECLVAWRVDRVDLLKIDVEGHEAKIFAGAENALRTRRIKSILCEFNDWWLREAGSSPQSLWETLAAAGFRDAIHANRRPTFAAGCIDTRLLVLRD